MKIQRKLLPLLSQRLTPGKVLVVYGPRRVGKTTLIQDFLNSYTGRYTWINVDELKNQEALSSQDTTKLERLVDKNELLVIDEAQRIHNIGINLKIIIDTFPHISIIATGSASLDLANKIKEPLTGRTWTVRLYPTSYEEIVATMGAFEAHTQLERWLIYGGYPDVITASHDDERGTILDEIIGSYLYKDILELTGIRHASKIVGLLRLLAFQIGKEVSVAELGSGLGMSKNTVERYLDLLEQSFVVYYVSGLSRNLRKEIAKNGRYYFYDNGIRNALIGNFNAFTKRDDIGSLWENFCAIERRKYNAYRRHGAHYYFWRTYDQKEIDMVEESGGVITGYECKWNKDTIKNTIKQEFEDAYQKEHATVRVINKDNFEPFVGVEK